MTAYLWLLSTVAATVLAVRLRARLGGHPAANPVVLAAGALVVGLLVTHTSQADFVRGTRPLRLLLGPATVALAVPLARQLRRGGRRTRLEAGAATVGGFVTAAVAGGLGALGGRQVGVAMATKSVTTAIAVPIAGAADGSAALTAASVVATGVLGAVCGGWVLDRMRVRDVRARAVAMGTTAHAIGTAEVLRTTPDQGGSSVQAMLVNGIATALWLPVVLSVLS